MTKAPLAIFRADSTSAIGVGHVMRCLAVADAWRQKGGRALLMSRTQDTLADAYITGAGLERLEIDSDSSLEDDALRIAEEGRRLGASWIVLDGYDFDLGYEDIVRRDFLGGRIAVIDDFLRESKADLFVLPTSPLPGGSRISPGPTALLGGFKFTILRKDYASLSQQARKSPFTPSDILVIFGGTDSTGLTDPVAQALLPAARSRGWHLKVVSSQKLEKEPHIEWITPSHTIAAQIAASDLVICSASTVALEACACGIPQVVFVTADNQEKLATALCEAGASIRVDDLSTMPDAVASVLTASAYEKMSASASSVTDGLGAPRVASAMSGMDFVLRAPTDDDARFLFDLSNDAETRRASFQTNPIPWEEHSAWFEGRLADPGTWIRIVEDSFGSPFGVIRFQESVTGEYALSIALETARRGLKLAVPILKRCCRDFLHTRPGNSIRAEIKRGNTSSERAFIEAGFSLREEMSDRSIFYLVID